MQLQTADQRLDNDDDQHTRWTRRPTAAAAAAAGQGWIDRRDAGWEGQIDDQVAAKYHAPSHVIGPAGIGGPWANFSVGAVAYLGGHGSMPPPSLSPPVCDDGFLTIH